METLVENIKFDHGYTAKSPVIINVSFLLKFWALRLKGNGVSWEELCIDCFVYFHSYIF